MKKEAPVGQGCFEDCVLQFCTSQLLYRGGLAHTPRGISTHPVIRTRLDLKGTKETQILISIALNTFTHQRERTQESFNWSYILKIPLLKKITYSPANLVIIYLYAVIAKWFLFVCWVFWNTMAIGKQNMQLPI